MEFELKICNVENYYINVELEKYRIYLNALRDDLIRINDFSNVTLINETFRFEAQASLKEVKELIQPLLDSSLSDMLCCEHLIELS
ncbi:hypothetical protein ACET8G_11365 [Aeromonas veronii]